MIEWPDSKEQLGVLRVFLLARVCQPRADAVEGKCWKAGRKVRKDMETQLPPVLLSFLVAPGKRNNGI